MRRVRLLSIASLILVLFLLSHIMSTIDLPVIKKAEGRADFTMWANRTTRRYLPAGYDINGTSMQFIVDKKGTRCLGNFGIGNGSLRSLLSTVNVSSLFDPGSYMLPGKYLTGEIMVNGGYPDLAYGDPQREIFLEVPLLPGTIYGKLLGLPVTGGSVVDIAVRTIGYEYFNPKSYEAKLAVIGQRIQAKKAAAANQTG